MKVRSNWLTGRSRSTQILYFEWQNRSWVYKIAGLHEETIRSFEYAMRQLRLVEFYRGYRPRAFVASNGNSRP